MFSHEELSCGALCDDCTPSPSRSFWRPQPLSGILSQSGAGCHTDCQVRVSPRRMWSRSSRNSGAVATTKELRMIVRRAVDDPRSNSMILLASIRMDAHPIALA